MRPADDRFGSPAFSARAGASEKPRTPRPTEEMRRLVELHAREILAPFFRTLGLELHQDGSVTRCEGAVVIAKHEGEVHASIVEDLGAKMTAARELLDRVYGRPTTTLEHTGVEDAPPITVGLDLSALSDEELVQLQQIATKARPR